MDQIVTAPLISNCMICPHCGVAYRSGVRDSRPNATGIRRARHCLACGNPESWSTSEVHSGLIRALPQVWKITQQLRDPDMRVGDLYRIAGRLDTLLTTGREDDEH
jgi:hypothetical protein